MQNKITKEKLEKYKEITSEALKVAKEKTSKSKKKQAQEIIDMVENYLSDADYFKNKADYVNSFAAINYAHGWLDCGVRLGIFLAEDDKLFTIK